MFWYLATPYTNYPDGHEAAFREASANAALLVRHGVPVFCPIAHTHPMAEHLPAEVQDHEFWMEVDAPFMAAAFGAIVLKMPGWQRSRGVSHEIDFFLNRGKPVFYMNVGQLPCLATLRAYAGGWPR
jgi:nucleoside 2-deoxyribosyltransferase